MRERTALTVIAGRVKESVEVVDRNLRWFVQTGTPDQTDVGAAIQRAFDTWASHGSGQVSRFCKGSAKANSLPCRHDFRPSADTVTGMLGEATIRELDIGMTGSVVGPGDRDYETADRDSPLLLNCARTPDLADPSHVDWARSARNAVANYGKGGTYVNFTGEGGSDKSPSKLSVPNLWQAPDCQRSIRSIQPIPIQHQHPANEMRKMIAQQAPPERENGDETQHRI